MPIQSEHIDHTSRGVICPLRSMRSQPDGLGLLTFVVECKEGKEQRTQVPSL